MQRRSFLKSAAAASLSAAIAQSLDAADGRPPRILLRSSWQVVNIGDIAHTPGVLALLEKHVPQAEVVLWASTSLTVEVAAMLRRRFPSLQIVKGRFHAAGKTASAALAEAVDRADFLLHGSGPSLVAEKDVASWVQHTNKPFGVYGITYGGAGAEQRELLSKARFVFFRDSASLTKAKSDGISCPNLAFAPDGAFAVDLHNDEAAERFLAEHGLQPGRFVCCIGRLRYTPYWKIRRREMTALDRERHARNQEREQHDHEPLQAAIAAVVRETGYKVLVCPEDMSQMEVGRRLLVEPLPADVKKQVVWRPDFWLTDEALSTYVRSAGLFGLEMHSPIMCIGNGIPALVGRFAEQTSKGIMWRDIGLDDWLFDVDQPEDVARLTPTVLSMIQQPEAAREKVRRAQKVVAAAQRATMQVVKEQCRG